jgi:hypothetical protein
MSGVPTVPTTIPPFQLQLLASNLYGSTQDALEAGFGTSSVVLMPLYLIDFLRLRY